MDLDEVELGFAVNLGTPREALKGLSINGKRWWIASDPLDSLESYSVTIGHGDPGCVDRLNTLYFRVPVLNDKKPWAGTDRLILLLDCSVISAEQPGLYMEGGRVLEDRVADLEVFFVPIKQALIALLREDRLLREVQESIMSHQHFCDFAGHYWGCKGTALRPIKGDTEPSTCMCLNHQVSMEDGDHSRCSIELLACPEHREAQLQKMGTVDRPDEECQFEKMLAEMNTPEAKLKFERKHQYEREVLYAGLTDLNTGFDSESIGHFSPEDFLTVIDRCESLNVSLNGIEVFTTDVEPPAKVGFLGVEISPDDGGYDWARRLLREYMGIPDITICATFNVPDALLKSNPKQEGEPNQ